MSGDDIRDSTIKWLKDRRYRASLINDPNNVIPKIDYLLNELEKPEKPACDDYDQGYSDGVASEFQRLRGLLECFIERNE